MKGRKIHFMKKYGKLSLNYPYYPFLSAALIPVIPKKVFYNKM